MRTVLGLVLGATFTGGVLIAVAAWRGWQGPAAASRALAAGRRLGPRLWAALGAGLGVAVMTRWPVAAAATFALVLLWPRLFGGAAETRAKIDQLGAIAVWTESLRDTMAAAVGLEQAIIATADVPDPIRPQLDRLVGRLRSRVPLGVALRQFADEFDDASVDLVTAALVMNTQLRGSGLVRTLSALATTARAELEMRVRVEQRRKSLRRDASIIMGAALLFAGAVALVGGDFLAPYGTLTGQMVLVAVIAGFVAGFVWIRRASEIEPEPRFLAHMEGTDAGAWSR